MIRGLLLLLLICSTQAFAEEGKDFSPTDKFTAAISERQKHFEAYRTRLFNEEVCPGGDYSCVLKELRARGIQSSGDLDNGVSLLSFIAQNKFKKGECKEICRMNIYAEYSAALVDFISIFDRKRIFVNLLPVEHPETKYLIINEELRFFTHLNKLHEKLVQYRKKVDPSKIFHPELSKRMETIKDDINKLTPSNMLKGSYLSSLSDSDESLKNIWEADASNEEEKLQRKELVSLFRSEIK